MTPDASEQASAAPASASARAYLSGGLPAVYRDPVGAVRDAVLDPAGLDPAGRDAAALDAAAHDPFAVRWMRGLEQVLDPAVTMIDNLAWHLHPDLAPEPIVRLLLHWLGLLAAVDLPIDGARAVLMHAESVARRRGTLAGLQEILGLGFPDLDFQLRQQATFTEGDDPYERRVAPEPFLDVEYAYRERPDARHTLSPAVEQTVRRLIEIRLPAGVPYALRVRGAAAGRR
jgi:phage tail-like protein